MSNAEKCFLWERVPCMGPQFRSVTSERVRLLPGREPCLMLEEALSTNDIITGRTWIFIPIPHFQLSNVQPFFLPANSLKEFRALCSRGWVIFPWLHFNFGERKPDVMNAHWIEILGLLIKPDKASHPGKHSHWLLRNSFAFSRRCNSYFLISFLNQKLPFCKEQSLPNYIFFLVFQRVSNGKECGALPLSGSDSILPPAAREQQTSALFPGFQPLPSDLPSKTPPWK